jgi:hypothetical protein
MILLKILGEETSRHNTDCFTKALNEKFGETNWKLEKRINNVFVCLKVKGKYSGIEYFDTDHARIIIFGKI